MITGQITKQIPAPDFKMLGPLWEKTNLVNLALTFFLFNCVDKENIHYFNVSLFSDILHFFLRQLSTPFCGCSNGQWYKQNVQKN